MRAHPLTMPEKAGTAELPASPTRRRDGSEAFRQFMACWPTGIAIVTGSDGGRPVGCTANAVMPLSLTPPRLIVSLGHESRTLAAIIGGGTYALNVLDNTQDELSRRFATGSSGDRFDGVAFRFEHDVPILCNAAAWVVCYVRETVPLSDHVLVIGAPVRHQTDEDRSPLVWHRRRSWRLS